MRANYVNYEGCPCVKNDKYPPDLCGEPKKRNILWQKTQIVYSYSVKAQTKENVYSQMFSIFHIFSG